MQESPYLFLEFICSDKGQLQNEKGERAIGAGGACPNGSFALFILELASLFGVKHGKDF